MPDFVIANVVEDRKEVWKNGVMADYPVTVEGDPDTEYWVPWAPDKAPKAGAVLRNRVSQMQFGKLKLIKDKGASPQDAPTQPTLKTYPKQGYEKPTAAPKSDDKPDENYWRGKDMRISRQHSQEMAIRAVDLELSLKTMDEKDLDTSTKLLKHIKDWADRFDDDLPGLPAARSDDAPF